MEINMKIEFTVEDYFNELRVMENYYGHEEELYPGRLNSGKKA